MRVDENPELRNLRAEPVDMDVGEEEQHHQVEFEEHAPEPPAFEQEEEEQEEGDGPREGNARWNLLENELREIRQTQQELGNEMREFREEQQRQGEMIREIHEGQRRREYYEENTRSRSNNMEEMITRMFNFQFPTTPRAYTPWGSWHNQPPPPPDN